MIRKTYICDACGRQAEDGVIKSEGWLSLDYYWSIKRDWEETKHIFCCLPCLVKFQTAGNCMLVGIKSDS